MPELPDLQVFSNNLNRQLKNHTLHHLVLSKKAETNAGEAALKKAFEKQKLQQVYREGKELRFQFSNENILGLHLMLRGKLVWKEHDDEMPHSLLELAFDNKTLVLTDFQRRARIMLNPAEKEAPDVLSKNVNASFWKKQLQTKAAIKNVLTDQSVVRGIGNAYADEILWRAKISPFSEARKIPPAKISSLAKSIKDVLKNAEKQIAKKVPGIIGGEVRDFLIVHNAKHTKTPGGATIKSSVKGAGKTYYTDEQVLYK